MELSLSVGARPLQRGEFLVFSLKIGEKTYSTLATIETWLIRGALVDVWVKLIRFSNFQKSTLESKLTLIAQFASPAILADA